MEQRNIIAFNFVRRQSETSLMHDIGDHNANVLKSPQPQIRVGRSMTFTPRDFSRPGSTTTPRVTLPERFSRKIRRKKSEVSSYITGGHHGVLNGPGPVSVTGPTSVLNGPGGVGGGSLTNIDESDPDEDIDWEDRKRDMGRAISWVRQELLRLREQDKVLMARFLDLHAALKHAHGIRSCPTLLRSDSSLSSSSWLSLDDGSLSAPTDTPMHQRDVMLDFQQRTRENQRNSLTMKNSCKVGDGISASLSDGDLQGRVVSLRELRIANEQEFERFKQSLMVRKSEEFETDSVCSSDYNDDTLTRVQPDCSETESEADYNDDTLTRKSKKKVDNEITCDLEQDYDALFNSEYTDTLTKAPDFRDAALTQISDIGEC